MTFRLNHFVKWIHAGSLDLKILQMYLQILQSHEH